MTHQSMHLKNLLELYKSSVNIFNRHAPLVTKSVTLSELIPFVNAEIKHFKTAKRKEERKFRKTGVEKDYTDFKENQNAFNKHLNQLKTNKLTSKSPWNLSMLLLNHCLRKLILK